MEVVAKLAFILPSLPPAEGIEAMVVALVVDVIVLEVAVVVVLAVVEVVVAMVAEAIAGIMGFTEALMVIGLLGMLMTAVIDTVTALRMLVETMTLLAEPPFHAFRRLAALLCFRFLCCVFPFCFTALQLFSCRYSRC